MTLISVYNPFHRSRLLKSVIGASIVDVRRYYNEPPLLGSPEQNALAITCGVHLVTFVFSNGISIDLSGYSPRYVEAKRALLSGVKYVVSPNRKLNKPYPMVLYSGDHFLSSNTDPAMKNHFSSLLGEKVTNVSVIGETKGYEETHSRSLHAIYRGVVFHLNNYSFGVALGMGGREYEFNLLLDLDGINGELYTELNLPEKELPEYLLPYLDKQALPRALYAIEVQNLREWTVNNLDDLKEKMTEAGTDVNRVKARLTELEHLLLEKNTGILDLALHIDVQTSEVFLIEPFDTLPEILEENQLFLRSVIENIA